MVWDGWDHLDPQEKQDQKVYQRLLLVIINEKAVINLTKGLTLNQQLE